MIQYNAIYWLDAGAQRRLLQSNYSPATLSGTLTQVFLLFSEQNNGFPDILVDYVMSIGRTMQMLLWGCIKKNIAFALSLQIYKMYKLELSLNNENNIFKKFPTVSTFCTIQAFSRRPGLVHTARLVIRITCNNSLDSVHCALCLFFSCFYIIDLEFAGM